MRKQVEGARHLNKLSRLLPPITTDVLTILTVHDGKFEVPFPKLPGEEEGLQNGCEELWGALANVHEHPRKREGFAFRNDALNPFVDGAALVDFFVEPLFECHKGRLD